MPDDDDKSSKIYKDYQYALSCSVPHHFRVRISSIQLAKLDPSSTIIEDEPSSVNDDPYKNLQATPMAVEASSKGRACVYVTAQLWADMLTIPLHTNAISTHHPARSRYGGTSLVFNEWITLPVKYRDLPRHATLRLCIWGLDPVTPLGSTNVRLFTENGVLKDGLELCPISSDVIQPATLELYRLEKLKEKYDRGELRQNEYLDRASFRRMALLRRGVDSTTDDDSDIRLFESNEQSSILWLDFPYFGAPVLYEEEIYSIKAMTSFLSEANRGDSASVSGSIVGNSETLGEMCFHIYDPEIGESNPVEWKYSKLARGMQRGTIDPNLKPGGKEKSALDAIMSNPNDVLKREEKDLLWKFRYSLTDNRRAVTKFLLSVDWNDESEISQVEELLEKWSRKAPIDIADALKLLGRQKEFVHELVRKFAVATISKARDDELLDYLLQLVQALRYEKNTGGNDTMNTGSGDLDSDDEPTGMPPRGVSAVRHHLGPLAKFLISRVCHSLPLANNLYWYLKVESDGVGSPDEAMFKFVLNSMMEHLKSESKDIYKSIRAQDELFSRIALSHQQARDDKGRKEQKEEKLRQYLKVITWPKGLSVHMPLDPSVLVNGIVASSAKMFKSALYPAVIEFNTTHESSSSTSEGGESSEGDLLRGSFKLLKKIGGGIRKGDNADSRDQSSSSSSGSNASSYKVMFKNGDDLRQDQLIMQMFILMDRLLKKVNLDLQLTHYRILAKSKNDGLMEFVLNSSPVSHVVAEYKSPQVISFLRKHQPDPNGDYGISPRALNTYVKSVAGYCVLTYLLAIGDRHLDNLMLKTQGNLFHIDFGCIFGYDPKPFPPAFKLTKEMVEGMGGPESEHYGKFKTYCCQAYNWLRKSASLILNLLNLMIDSGIDALSTDPETILAKIQERFRLDLTDEQAEQFFLGLINDSVTSLFPVLMEYIHKVATKLR